MVIYTVVKMETKCLLVLLKEKGYIEFASNMDLDEWHMKEIQCEEEIVADKIIDNLGENFEYGEKLYFTRYENTVYIIHKEGFLKTFEKQFMEYKDVAKGKFTMPINHFIKHSEIIDILEENNYEVHHIGEAYGGGKLYKVIDKVKQKERIEKENNRKQEIKDFINNLP